MQVVINAGGEGTRLRPLTYLVPKSMVPIHHERPFLWYLLTMLRVQGFKNFLVCTGYLGGQIRTYFGDGGALEIDIEYSHEVRPMGTGGALRNALAMLEQQFIYINGDTLLPLDYHKFKVEFMNCNRMAMLAVNEVKSGNCMVGSKFNLVGYRKGGYNSTYTDAGVWGLCRTAVEKHIKEGFVSLETDVLPALIRDSQVKVFPAAERFYDIGTHSSLEEFKEVTHVNS